MRRERPVGVTFPRVVRAEWLKLRSVPTGVHGAVIVLACILVVSPLACVALSERFGSSLSNPEIAERTLPVSIIGTQLAQLALAAIGALFITGEYATGLIRTSMAAVPRRWPVLAAKALVLSVSAVALTLPVIVLAFLMGQYLLSPDDGPLLTLGDGGIIRALIGASLYLALVGVLGLSLGAVMRNAALALSVFASILFIFPTMASLLPPDWANSITPYLLGNAGQALSVIDGDPWGEERYLGWWQSLGVCLGWSVFFAAFALVRLRREDV